jgi:hypothetical protein
MTRSFVTVGEAISAEKRGWKPGMEGPNSEWLVKNMVAMSFSTTFSRSKAVKE